MDVAIDMDVAGNDARLSGGVTVEACGEITSAGSNTIQLDIILPAPGVDAADGLQAYQFDLLYDPAVVNVTGEDQAQLITAAAGSVLFSLSEFPPDSDGTFSSAAAELGAVGIEPAGSYEVGPGVLSRITLTGVAPGTSNLTLSNVILAAADGSPLALGNIVNATVEVDGACAAGIEFGVNPPAEENSGPSADPVIEPVTDPASETISDPAPQSLAESAPPAAVIGEPASQAPSGLGEASGPTSLPNSGGAPPAGSLAGGGLAFWVGVLAAVAMAGGLTFAAARGRRN